MSVILVHKMSVRLWFAVGATIFQIPHSYVSEGESEGRLGWFVIVRAPTRWPVVYINALFQKKLALQKVYSFVLCLWLQKFSSNRFLSIHIPMDKYGHAVVSTELI